MVPSGVRWRRRLDLRLAAGMAGVVIATGGVLAGVGLRAQRRQVVAEAVRGAALLSETIRNSTHQHMLEDRRQDAYSTMRTIGAQEGIEKVRIFNKEGRITFSTHAGETGSQVDKRAESCDACHAAGQPIVRLSIPSRSRVYHTGGHRVLSMVTPIYNEASCSGAACHAHPQTQRVLGVVDVGVSLAESDRSLRDLGRQTVAAGALGLLVLVSGVGFFTRRIVTRPVAGLVNATRRLAEGELDHRIPLAGAEDDEIGLLARSFNSMTASLARAQGEIRELMAGLERQVEQRTAALRDAQAQLAQSEKLSSLGRMAASIAHEINNPLAGILTFAKLLIRNLEDEHGAIGDGQATLRHLRLVEREAGRCTAIVRNLLEFARQRPLALAPAEVNAAVEEALSLVAHQLSLRRVELEKELAPLPLVQADFGQLRQAFVNVVLNAGDAMAGGGRLRVSSRAREGGVEVGFEDTGVGIPPEHLARIFDPFFSTKEKGTGLGLSVVYGIVQRHGGELDVRSEPGRGTTVVLRLPLAAPAAASA